MLILYTDGSIRKRRGSWAYVIVDADPATITADYNGAASGRILYYGVGLLSKTTSSSHSELFAALRGLERIAREHPDYKSVMVVSDSLYVVNGLKKPYQFGMNSKHHTTLWLGIVKTCVFREINTQHVKGHQKHTYNTFVDWLCGQMLVNFDKFNAKKAVRMFNNLPPWRKSLILTHK